MKNVQNVCKVTLKIERLLKGTVYLVMYKMCKKTCKIRFFIICYFILIPKKLVFSFTSFFAILQHVFVSKVKTYGK